MSNNFFLSSFHNGLAISAASLNLFGVCVVRVAWLVCKNIGSDLATMKHDSALANHNCLSHC